MSGLSESAAPVLKALADVLAKPEDCPPFADLQERLHQRLAEFEANTQRAGASFEEVAAAKYALVALIDESVMLSELPARDDWLSAPLQLRYFDEVTAGEEFYNRIDQVRGARRYDALEIYWLCLAFGFKGKYGDRKGGERRRILMDALASEINQARGVDPRAPLSPQATAAAANALDLPRWPLIRLAWWIVPSASLAGVLAVWLITTLISTARLSDLAEAASGAETRPERAAESPKKPAKPAKPEATP
ncbi:hypothetical protein LBMAG53_32180 [Planctomycetota bacterium]|nr:hypothetical protein LBMAG53_32180 [Planctomycetota bacterium]